MNYVKFILFAIMVVSCVFMLFTAVYLCALGIWAGGIMVAVLGLSGTGAMNRTVYRKLIGV